MATKFNKPTWAPAQIDPKGWRHTKTGELLVSRRFTAAEIEEYNGIVMEKDKGGNIEEPSGLDESELEGIEAVPFHASEDPAPVELSEKTKDELREVLDRLNVEWKKSWNKDKLIAEIESAPEE